MKNYQDAIDYVFDKMLQAMMLPSWALSQEDKPQSASTQERKPKQEEIEE